MTIEILHGDCRALLSGLPDRHFRTCVTSPPYLWQRKYLPAGHADEAREIGQEPTIAGYVEGLVALLRLVREKLADDGTLWLNLGDAYANDAKWGGSTSGTHATRFHGKTATARERHHSGLPPKCLMMLPARVALALIDDGWTLRAEIVWEKPNAMPSSVEDRPTRTHEMVFLFSKFERYYFDGNAIREAAVTTSSGNKKRKHADGTEGRPQTHMGRGIPWTSTDGGRHPRSVWSINTEPGDGEHAAPMPRALARRCLLAGSAIGDHVLDPFGGSGTVGVVAEEEGRHATLIDLDERACAQAEKRTRQQGLYAGRAA